MLFAATILGAMTFSFPSLGIAKPYAQTAIETDILSNGQFVWGPNVGNFDTAQFLLDRGSALAAYADIVESWAHYYSINPRVLLTLLEVQQGWVTSMPVETTPDEINTVVEEIGLRAYGAYYDHLYTWGEMRPPDSTSGGPAPSIQLADGAELVAPEGISSASFAITNTLGATTDEVGLNKLIAPGEPAGFTETFGALFPQEDPLDTSNDIVPDSVPPDELFQFPFPLGATWAFGGPHNWAGNGGYPFSSIDFYTGWGGGPPYPYHYSVSAAAGSGHVFTPNPVYSTLPCWVKVDHSGDWTTYYYHLRNVRPPGSIGNVNPNDRMGTIAEEICNNGFAFGSHVHFTLLHNGAFISLEGIKLSGWTVHVGPPDEPYSSGSLERDGVVLNPYNWVENDYLDYYGDGLDYNLRFYGNSPGDLDRVKIRIDDIDTDYAGPPVDVGYTDFTIEFWLKANAAENTASAITCGANSNWTLGNVVFDSSRTNMPEGLGVSIAGGKLAYGLSTSDGELTLCSSTDVTDGEWHHIAVERNRWGGAIPDGYLWLYVDGVLEAEGPGPGGDPNYIDDAAPSSTQDPFLFIGAGKEGRLPFSGWLEEIRFSNTHRYTAPTFTVPDQPLTADSATIALFHLDEGSGDLVFDVSGFRPTNEHLVGAPSNGVRFYGGSPPGPDWVLGDPVLPYKFFFPVIAR